MTSPAHRATIVSIAAAQTPLDYTLPLVRNRVVMTEATASLAHRAGRDWDFGAAAGAGRFAVGGSGQENRRLAVGAGARRRLTDRWAVAAGARLHGFDRDIDGGFFDPDLYALVDASLLWNTESPWWLLDAEIAPGVQRIGSDGTTSAAIRAAAAATWRLRPGRQIAVRGTFANAGFQQLTADSRGAYRYASIAISLEWWF